MSKQTTNQFNLNINEKLNIYVAIKRKLKNNIYFLNIEARFTDHHQLELSTDLGK